MTNITENHNDFLLTDPVSCGESSGLSELVNANLQINTNYLKGECLHIMNVSDSSRHWLLPQTIRHIYSTGTQTQDCQVLPGEDPLLQNIEGIRASQIR